MIGSLVARRANPGGVTTLWLCRHELRLQMKQWRIDRYRIALFALLAAYVVVGIVVALSLRAVPIRPTAPLLGLITAVILFVGSLMISQAMLQATRTLFLNNDLMLLMTAPVSPGRVFAAKFLGVAAGLATVYGSLILPLILPLAAIVDPGLLGVVPVLAFLSIAASLIAMSALVVATRSLGVARARAFGNIAAAIFGGLFFLLFQLLLPPSDAAGSFSAIGLGAGIGPDHAMFVLARGVLGDPPVLLALAAATCILILASVRLAGSAFRLSLQEAGAGAVRRAPRRGGAVRGSAGPFGSVVTKEFLVLLREPELLFQVALRLMYLVPLVYIALRGRSGNAFVLAAAIAFVTGQLCSSIAWLMISGEDVPDLLATSPVPRATIRRAKLAAAILPSAGVAAIICAVLAYWHPFAAICAFVVAMLVALAVGSIEIALAEPQPKSRFGNNKDADFVRVMLILSMSLAISAGGAWIGHELHRLLI